MSCRSIYPVHGDVGMKPLSQIQNFCMSPKDSPYLFKPWLEWINEGSGRLMTMNNKSFCGKYERWWGSSINVDFNWNSNWVINTTDLGQGLFWSIENLLNVDVLISFYIDLNALITLHKILVEATGYWDTMQNVLLEVPQKLTTSRNTNNFKSKIGIVKKLC